ncbi:MAG: class I SAM-dependent methyltransferase [bacterium]
MESHPELFSDGARLSIRKKIHSAYSRINYDIYDLTRQLLDLRPSEDVLDVGSGLGEFLLGLRLKGHFGKLIGIDRSADVIDKARRESFKRSQWVEFRVGDAEDLNFPSNGFDCVTALHVLGHASPEKALMEIGRVLRADGRVVLSTNSRMCFPLLEKLKQEARERFGWFLATEWVEGFDSESAGEMIRRYFGNVEETRYDDVLQYPDAEVLVDLFRSSRGIWSDRMNEAEWERIVDWARDRALELIPEHGYAEDPKSFSLFRCTAPLGL